jgi:membrane protein DedA with SNARE-associated domain
LFESEIQPLIAQHAYTAVFLVILLEGLGSPLPGETVLVAAAVYAGATHHINIAIVIAVAIAGAVMGGSGGYWIGRSAGASVIERYGKFIGLNANRLALGRYLFERHGGKIVFFGRFVAVLRVVAALLAGLNKYDWRSFFFFNAAGTVAWASIMGLGGYIFGKAISRVSSLIGVAGLVVALGFIFAFWLFMRREEQKMEERLTEVAFAETSNIPPAQAAVPKRS